MISLSVLFYLLICLFVLIGAMRGFSKEALVLAASVIGLFGIEVVLPKLFTNLNPANLFWVRLAIMVVCAFLGYQTPNLPTLSANGHFARRNFRDFIMGAGLGAVNGYVLVSSIWYFLSIAGYPLAQISAPDAATEAGQAAIRILEMAFPTYMQAPVIYYAVFGVFVIIIGVFI